MPPAGGSTMRALVKAQPAVGLWMQELPTPDIGPDEVLIKIRKMAICGTDLHIYKWDQWAQSNVPVPTTVGHEYSGEIVAVGSRVTRVCVGERVSGEGHIVGERSRNVRAGRFHLDPETRGIGVNLPGAFAEYLVLPAFNAISLPDYVDDEIGALLDPLGNAVHTTLAYNLVGEDVLITGAGPIGIMAAAVARFVGARHVVITDVNDYRLELARHVRDVRTVNIGREKLADVMRELQMAEGFDVGLEMSGAPGAFEQMVETMVMGGRIALLGLPPAKSEVDWSRVILKALEIKGIYGREMFETWYRMLALIRAGLDLRFLITHRFSITDYEQAFATALQGRSGKIVLSWP